MHRRSRLSGAIGRVYDAATDDDGQWNFVLCDICHLTGVNAASIRFTNRGDHRDGSALMGQRWQPYKPAAGTNNPARNFPLVDANPPVPGDRSKESPWRYFYRHARSPNETSWSILLQPCAHLFCELRFYQPADAPPLSAGRAATLDKLSEHIARAVRIGANLRTVSTLHAAALDMLESLPVALMLFGRRGHLLHANAAALALTMEEDGLSLACGGLRLARASDQTRFQTLVDRILFSAETARPGAHDTMALRRPSGNRPLALRISRVTPWAPGLSTVQPHGMIAITDPDARYAVPLARIRSLFSLSAAEGRLALYLADGEDLRNAARAQNIHYETARKYLGAIFRKTGTRRQAELVRLLSVTLPYLTGGGD